MSQIFISYKREQIDLASPLEKTLKEAGFDVWMDRHIHAGTDWREIIDEEVRKSFALIVIMTPEAKISEYVTYEWAFAYGAGVRVIPLLFIEPDALHPRLKTLQYLDFRNAQPMDNLINALRNAQSTYLAIHYAVWGAKEKIHNVTREVVGQISGGKLDMIAQNEILRDPARGDQKMLIIFYSYGGKIGIEEIEEDGRIVLPK